MIFFLESPMGRIHRSLHIAALLAAGALFSAGCAASSEPLPPRVVEEPEAQACVFSALATEVPQAPAQTTAPEILGVGCLDGRLAVYFSAYKNGRAVTVAPGDASFALAKLVPAADGDTGEWVSYLNRTETPTPGVGTATEPKIQATTENTGILKLLSAGVYAYAFTSDITAVTAPVPVSFDASLTHRVGIEFRGDILDPALGNPTFTWRPAATTATEAVLRRDMVATASCTSCHGGLAAHGGARTDVQYCVLCHNPGTTDANSGESMNLSSLVHRIHMGEKLPSVEAGGDFVVYGHRDSKHDFSEVVYPQDQRNCRKCHDGENAETPQAARWQTAVSIAACSTCHDTLDITSDTTTHAAGKQTDDASCVTCHGAGKTHSVENAHVTDYSTPHNPLLPGDLPHIEYEISSLTLDASNQPVARFSIFADGSPLDLKNKPVWVVGLASGTGMPRFTIAHAITEGTVAAPGDWNNLGNGQNYAQTRSFGFSSTFIGGLVSNGDGSFTTTPGQLGTVPAGANMVAATLESYLRVDRNGNGAYDSGIDAQIGGDSVIRGVGSEGTPRREKADINKCNACHERIELHGGNRVNNLNVCATCHNPNATDVNRRVPDAPDGLAERSIALSYLIHGIHMGEKLSGDHLLWYGFGNSEHDFKHVKFPNDIANCETCHNPGTYELPIDDSALAVTVRTYDRALTWSTDIAAAKQGAEDDLNVTPTGAACIGCHDSSSTQAHAMASSYYFTANLHGTENDSCATCHGTGEAYDVRSVHGLPPAESAAAPFLSWSRMR